MKCGDYGLTVYIYAVYDGVWTRQIDAFEVLGEYLMGRNKLVLLRREQHGICQFGVHNKVHNKFMSVGVISTVGCEVNDE